MAFDFRLVLSTTLHDIRLQQNHLLYDISIDTLSKNYGVIDRTLSFFDETSI